MRDEPFVEKTFLAVKRYSYKDGSKEWAVMLFGVHLLLPTDRPLSHYSGFLLSLYNLHYVKRYDEDADFTETLKQIRRIPLLQYFLGENKSHEIPYPETRHPVTVNGKEYFITKVWRYNCYALFDQLMAIRKSKQFVYQVDSVDDPDIPNFTFCPPEWAGREPSDHEIINTAKELQKIVNGFGTEE